MASTFQFAEDNGTQTSNPFRGTTRTFARSEVNWKNVDDSTTAYDSSPITAGNNSYPKYQFGVITGTFNQISNGKFGHTTGILGAGLTLVAKISSGYLTPATTALAGAIDMTTPSGLGGSFQTVLFGAAGPEQAGAATLAASGYTQYFATQLQTTTGASAGDTSSVTFTFSYDES